MIELIIALHRLDINRDGKLSQTSASAQDIITSNIIRIIEQLNLPKGTVIDCGPDSEKFAIECAKKFSSQVVLFEDDQDKIEQINSRLTSSPERDSIEIMTILPCSKHIDNVSSDQFPTPIRLDNLKFSSNRINLVRINKEMELSSFISGAKHCLQIHYPLVLLHTEHLSQQFTMQSLSMANYYLFLFSPSLVFAIHENEKDTIGNMLVSISKAHIASHSDDSNELLSLMNIEIDRLRKLNREFLRLSNSLQKENRNLLMKTEHYDRIKSGFEKVIDLTKKIQNHYDSNYSSLFYEIKPKKFRKNHPYPRDLRKPIGAQIEELHTLLEMRNDDPKPAGLELPYLLDSCEIESVPTRIGIAAIPSRLKSLERTIESLHNQVDDIFVSLNGYSEIPSSLNQWENVHLSISENIGDLAKFSFQEGFNGVYMTCDDDLVYPPYYVKSLIYYLQKYEYQAVVGWHGSILSDEFRDYYDANSRRVLSFGTLQSVERSVHILGTGCMAFHTKFLQIPLSTFKIPNIADVFFAINAQKNKIPLIQIPHLGGQITEDMSDNDLIGSISGNSISQNTSNLNVRTETTNLVKSWQEWKKYRYHPNQENRNISILIIGRFDYSRWKKGGVFKSCKQLSKHLQNGGFTISEREIESPVNEIIKQMNSNQYDLIITYTGDNNAKDYYPINQIVNCSKEILTPTIFNLSYDGHPERTSYIQKTLRQTKDTDALMLFTSEAKMAVSCNYGINNSIVIPKTISAWEPNDSVFHETSGIFLGDIAKFVNERLNPHHIEIFVALMEEFPDIQLFFVAQYGTKDIPEIIANNCKIFPHSHNIGEIISQCRIYVHTPNYCTFEMLPVEAMTSGIPICYREMPQSLNHYIGDSGLKFDSIDSMLIAIRSIYFSEDNWSELRKSGIQRGLSLSEKQITMQMTQAIESFLSARIKT